MADEVRLDIVTPTGILFSEMVSLVQYKGPFGYTTILKDHAPMMTIMDFSAIRYIKDGQEHYLSIGQGYLEVEKNVVIVITNTMERAEDIDVERAKAAEQRARDRLEGRVPDKKPLSSQKALRHALMRQQIAALVKEKKELK
jgi:F-type H+-transporting ATPase subunit epsilon